MMSNLESIQEKHMCKISKYVEKTADGKYIGRIYKRTLVKEDCPDNGKVYVKPGLSIPILMTGLVSISKQWKQKHQKSCQSCLKSVKTIG